MSYANVGACDIEDVPSLTSKGNRGIASGPCRNVQIHGRKIWRNWRRWWKRPKHIDVSWMKKDHWFAECHSWKNAEFRNKWIWERVNESENDECNVLIRRYLHCIVSPYYVSFFPIRAWLGAWPICSLMLVYLVCTCELRKSINESIQARSPCGMLVTKMKEIEDGTFVAINRDKRMKYLVETKQCKWGSTYIFPFVCLCVLLPENKALDKKHVRKKKLWMFPI